jgi:hypothetical protein
LSNCFSEDQGERSKQFLKKSTDQNSREGGANCFSEDQGERSKQCLKINRSNHGEKPFFWAKEPGGQGVHSEVLDESAKVPGLHFAHTVSGIFW